MIFSCFITIILYCVKFYIMWSNFRQFSHPHNKANNNAHFSTHIRLHSQQHRGIVLPSPKMESFVFFLMTFNYFGYTEGSTDDGVTHVCNVIVAGCVISKCVEAALCEHVGKLICFKDSMLEQNNLGGRLASFRGTFAILLSSMMLLDLSTYGRCSGNVMMLR